jgi:alcohol dehydrogenase (cytochrome c)
MALGSKLPKQALIVALSVAFTVCWSSARGADLPLEGGQISYSSQCASCHGAALGGGFGPPLTGKPFYDKWSAPNAPPLGDYIAETMPPTSPGSLGADVYRAISAFLTRVNSLPARAASVSDVQESSGGEFDPMTVALDSSDPYYRAILARRQARLGALSPVTRALLRSPPPHDWLTWRRSSDTLGYSPLQQIDRSNVSALTLAWSRSLSDGTNGIAPIVHDGVMFLNTSGTIMARDAANGDLLWRYQGDVPAGGNHLLSQPRGVAAYNESLVATTLDGHVFALNAHTGKLLWDHRVFEASTGLQLDAVPLVAHDIVIQGVSGCYPTGGDARGGCFIVALDARTGQELWRFYTISRPGFPGADSWNGALVEDRYGASVWSAGSFDPDLNLVFFGTGQTYHTRTLLLPNKRKGESADALFTDSTLALDLDTGKLVWYYQHLQGDVWDLDWAFEQTLVNLDTGSGMQRAVVTGGKQGLFDVLDARSGKYLFSFDMGIQNLVTAIDPHTGRKRINPQAHFSTGHDGRVCPYPGGGRNWPSTSYDPVAGLLFVPMVESCMTITSLASNAENLGSWQLKPRPDSDGKFGRVTAFDLKNHKIVWTDRFRAPPSSAMLSTGGGLVFEGGRDRTFRALDRDTGKSLWEFPLSDAPNSFPLTYSVDGAQYVAVVLGGNTPFDLAYSSLTPEIAKSNGKRSIWVFRLPASRYPATELAKPMM